MRRLFAVLLTISLISCNTDTNSYTIDGLAAGFEDNTTLLVYTLENNSAKIVDTLIVSNGKFSGKFSKKETSNVHYFHLPKYKANILFFPENEDLNVTLYKDSIQSSFVSGSPQNEAYTNYTQKLRSYNAIKQDQSSRFQAARSENDRVAIAKIQNEARVMAAEESAIKIEFISSNVNSSFSVMLLSELVSKKEITASEATELIGKLSPKVTALSITKDLKKSLAEIKQSDVGGIAPGFSAPSPDGKVISLQDALGKYTIIDFWASWCRPCRAENPNVVRVYNKYHNKGLNIISVSLDKAGQKDRWIKAIADDKMDWHHVSNLKSWQEPIAKMYGVRSIPATFLLDENGKIIGKNLRGAALESKIASLFGE
ncbi:MAG: thiol-disulfide isomerase/thioredoxin [Flavobacteriaceae bacterium]|jgi:thiol-disulfide isomerase/thioredoxin